MKTLLLFATFCAMPLLAADVAGNWKVDGDIAGNAIDPLCSFKAADNKLTGTCKSSLGDAPLTGSVDGQKVTWQYDIEYMGSKYTLVFTGTLSSDSEMKGTVDAGVAAGDFKAKKEQ